VSAKQTKTLIALAAALTGCELVAGIQDLTYTKPEVGVGEAGGGADGPIGQAESGGDDSGSPEAGTHDAVAMPDGSNAEVGSDASGDGLRDALADAVVGDATSEVLDGTLPPEAGDSGPGAPDASEGGADGGDAGTVATVVPIPGPDGGSLSVDGGDGGPLLGELIDDIDSETTPGWILRRSGRFGTWFTFDDNTAGGIVPAQNSAPSAIVVVTASFSGTGSNMAAHMTGNGLAAYAGMGFNLNGGAPNSYDATAYQGFTFWARIGADSGTATVQFAVPDRNTSAQGGVCPADASTGCGDYFAKNLTVTPTWQQFVIYYNQLGQTGFGLPTGLPGLDAAHLYSCQFQFTRPGPAFDVWIDDVYFISK
jgi:hypothetical protein